MKKYKIYGIYDEAGTLVYVGCTKREPRMRFNEAIRLHGPIYTALGRTPDGYSFKELAVYDDIIEATDHEQRLYKEHRPRFNGKDWSTPYRNRLSETAMLDPMLSDIWEEMRLQDISTKMLVKESGVTSIPMVFHGTGNLSLPSIRKIVNALRKRNPAYELEFR